MQDCFREHPDVYGAELDDDEEEAENHEEEESGTAEPPGAAGHVPKSAQPSTPTMPATDILSATPDSAQRDNADRKQRAEDTKRQVREDRESTSGSK